AKITGAGGGGYIVALASDERARDVASALEPISARVMVLDVTREGARVEEA
ncbi:MAG: mevalonate kinase, partial [Thermoprotei archaeon]